MTTDVYKVKKSGPADFAATAGLRTISESKKRTLTCKYGRYELYIIHSENKLDVQVEITCDNVVYDTLAIGGAILNFELTSMNILFVTYDDKGSWLSVYCIENRDVLPPQFLSKAAVMSIFRKSILHINTPTELQSYDYNGKLLNSIKGDHVNILGSASLSGRMLVTFNPSKFVVTNINLEPLYEFTLELDPVSELRKYTINDLYARIQISDTKTALVLYHSKMVKIVTC